VGTDQAKFIAKARAFLRQHLDHIAIAKLRMNKPFTDLTARGPDGLFSPVQLDELMCSLEAVRATAVAA
jgi:hypothetical protein